MMSSTSLGLRLPKALYDRLKAQARRSRRSLNNEVVHVLSSGGGGTPLAAAVLGELAEEHRVLRLRHAPTGVAADHLSLIVTSLSITAVNFGVRQDPEIGGVLVCAVSTDTTTFLSDRSSMNVARGPRAREIRRLLETIAAAGLADACWYSPSIVEATGHLSPEEALVRLRESGGKPRAMEGVHQLLSVCEKVGSVDRREFDGLEWDRGLSG